MINHIRLPAFLSLSLRVLCVSLACERPMSDAYNGPTTGKPFKQQTAQQNNDKQNEKWASSAGQHRQRITFVTVESSHVSVTLDEKTNLRPNEKTKTPFLHPKWILCSQMFVHMHVKRIHTAVIGRLMVSQNRFVPTASRALNDSFSVSTSFCVWNGEQILFRCYWYLRA